LLLIIWVIVVKKLNDDKTLKEIERGIGGER